MEETRKLQFKRAFANMVATSRRAYEKTDNKVPRNRESFFSREEIDRIVACGDPVARAELSEFFFNTSGLYKRIILHYASFLTYSWLLVPQLKRKNDKITDKKIAQTYYSATNFCSDFQIETKCTYFAKEVLVKGGYYGLVQYDGDDIVIQDLPFEFCRSRFKNNKEIDIVEFDLKFFDVSIKDNDLRKEILKTYPSVIQKGYWDHKDPNKKGPRWLFLPADMGFYFSFFEERPFFLDIIPLLDDLADYEAIDKKRNIMALKKILVQKIGVDGTKLVFEPDEAEEFHYGTVEMLSDNDDMDVLTTYNTIDLLDLSSDDDEKTEVEDIQKLIYSSAGISSEYFNPTTDSGQDFSANNDLAMMMILGRKFAHFFTTLLNYKFETNKIKFKFIIVPLSNYNADDYATRAKDLSAFGYSFLTPILTTGLDQTNLVDLKKVENDLLKLDEVLKPLQSSYTYTGEETTTKETQEVKDDGNSE